MLCTTSTLGDDDKVLEFVASAIPSGTPGLVAMDAPLAVPNETGSRPCDRQLAAIFGQFEAAPYPANRRSLVHYGGLRGEAISQRLRQRGFHHDPSIAPRTLSQQATEVFPHPATISLFDLERTLKYKARSGRSYSQRWRELERLRQQLISLAGADPELHLSSEVMMTPIEGRKGRAFKEAEDVLDAIVCAYGAFYAWHHGPPGYAVYGRIIEGDDSEGHILVQMTASMWERIKTRQLLLLDRDGTLNQRLGRSSPLRPNEVRLIPGVGPRLRQHAALGWRLVVVTNQGGAAFGYQTQAQAEAAHRAVLDALPVHMDGSYLCPHHPEGTVARYSIDCPCRKPGPGAILHALKRFGGAAEDCLFGRSGHRSPGSRIRWSAFVWAVEFFG